MNKENEKIKQKSLYSFFFLDRSSFGVKKLGTKK